MNRRHGLVIASLLCLMGCTETGGGVQTDCEPACESGEDCVNGICEPKVCEPACNPYSESCVNGECVAKVCEPACDPVSEICVRGVCQSACDPACHSLTETCVQGVCEPKVCDPECGDDEVCVQGQCEHKDACSGKICKDEMTYCNEETGRWARCELGTGCHLGFCLEGLGIECEGDVCSEDGERFCSQGKWVSCGSLETCVDGHCKLSEDAECSPGSCSDDGLYSCNEEGQFEACSSGYVCEEGRCVLGFNEQDAQLWTLCNKNSDCSGGHCTFSLKPSRALSNTKLNLLNATSIPVSAIDYRIPEGYGICAEDCTDNITICEQKGAFSCQVVVIGDSPYPPKDSDGQSLSLPFFEQLDLGLMQTAPYAALCRPKDVKERFYSKTFCESCQTSLDCSENEICVGGSCLSQCSMLEMCPIGFSCVEASVDSEDLRVCMPNSGTCQSCLDLDGDGQGYGHCSKGGFDCDPVDPNIYYTTDLPKSCVHSATDTNCNGMIDTFELLGSSEHCRFCNDECYLPESSTITRNCEKYAGKEIDQYNFSQFNHADESTYLTYCHDICSEGYADCDGDSSNGCERQLAVKTDEGIWQAVDAGSSDPKILHAPDRDGDLQGSTQKSDDYFYCCNPSMDVCYAPGDTTYNSRNIWYETHGGNWDSIKSGETGASYDVADCLDTDPKQFTSGAELCDGIDNDCDSSTFDGINDAYVDKNNGNKVVTIMPYDASNASDYYCVIKNDKGVICDTEGVVKCGQDNTGKFRMYCHSNKNNTVPDDTCNGVDDNCNGDVDEQYQPKFCYLKNWGGEWNCTSSFEEVKKNVKNTDGSINLCRIGVKSCIHTSSNGTFKGEEKVLKAFIDTKESSIARPYDFYGDGIDSDCDGFDYDEERAVFLNKYNGNTGGTSYGHDGNNGTKNNPFATLEKAFTEACNDKENYCHDIFVAQDMTSLSNTVWDGKPIEIPVFEGKHTFSEGYNVLKSIDSIHTANKVLHEGKVSRIEQACLADGCMNKMLLPGEDYAPKEAVRIYGGFDFSSLKQDGTTYYSYTNVKKQNVGVYDRFQALIYPGIKKDSSKNPVGSMSLKLSHMQFTFGSDSDLPGDYDGDYYRGMTMAGLSCGRLGCRHITLDDVIIQVVGLGGISPQSALSSNTLFGAGENSDSNGVNGNNFYEDNGKWSECKSNFVTNWDYNACLPSAYSTSTSGNSGREIGWLSVSMSDYNKTCPDGKSPRGGAPASRCCKNNCNENRSARNGYSGGIGGTSGSGKSLSINTGDGCNDDDSYKGQNDEDIKLVHSDFGGNGKHGNGGSGGKVISRNKDYCKLYSTSGVGAGYYVDCDSSQGNGGAGQSGGGGGGGAVYRCYDRNGLDDGWVYAGGGGAGGCGGRGGRAGGMGASVIGMLLVPPQNTADTLELTVNPKNPTQKAFLRLESGRGGAGQEGQKGRLGGFRGKGFGHGSENWANNDQHCHKATAGGIGGTGGGGGGGAGGLRGDLRQMVIVCNRDTAFSTASISEANKAEFANCGFSIEDSWFAATGIYTSSQKFGSSGTNGQDGAKATKKIDDVDGVSSPAFEGYTSKRSEAEKEYTAGGTAGSAGQLNDSSQDGFEPILLIKDTNFK